MNSASAGKKKRKRRKRRSDDLGVTPKVPSMLESAIAGALNRYDSFKTEL